MNSTSTLIADALLTANGCVWNLGQLQPEDLRWLAREVRAGRLVKSVAFWPYFYDGTCKKTVWRPA